ncbi:hypothetical protein ABN238_17670 [Providencia rettgeri]|uniref:hypothetical protein n=1 Tax=Providencia rettgeri TaxID=587 RepID=UPI0032DAD714
MTGKSEFFSNFIDIEKRKNFSIDQEISPENFKELIGEYILSEEVACQVRAKGGICHQNHKKGWLGATKDGIEALIGGHCARNYFKADKSFALEKKRVRREIDRKKHLDKMNEFYSNPLEFMSELSDLRQKIICIRKKFDEVNKLLPNVVLVFIENARKTKKWEIKVDVLKGESQENKKWITETLENLKPLPYKYEILSTVTKIRDLIETYDEISKIDIDTLSTPKLNDTLAILNGKEDIEKSILKLSKQVDNFIKATNLENLIYTCNDNDDEFILTKAIMILTGSKALSDGHVNLRTRRIKERIEKRLGGYPIRKNQLVDKYSKSSIFSS